MKKLPEMACQLCYPGIIDVGEIGRCVWISKYKGRYRLFFGQGHKDDIIHTFRIKPFPEPSIYMKMDGSLATKKEEFSYKDRKFYVADKYCEKYMPSMSPIEGYQLIKACMGKPGYYRPSMRGSGLNFNMWLFFKCGELIEEYEKRKRP